MGYFLVYVYYDRFELDRPFCALGARIRWNDDEETALHSGGVGVKARWDP
jgi:hypothetical protein